MKNILLPTDFSDNSLNAIDYAMHFFQNWSCTFYVLNVQKPSEYITDDFMGSPLSSSVYQTIAQDNKTKLKNLIKKYKTEYKSETYTFKSLFDFDNLTEAINQILETISIDLIIMGTNGATGAREVIFGSNTLHLIRNSKVPVLAIPEDYKFKGIFNILFSTVNCVDFNFNAIKPLHEILNIHQSVLKVLDITDDAISKESKANKQTCISNLFPDTEYEFYHINGIPRAMAINAATQLLDIDFHALFVEAETFVERFIFESETAKISYGTQVPLLLLQR